MWTGVVISAIHIGVVNCATTDNSHPILRLRILIITALTIYHMRKITEDLKYAYIRYITYCT